MGNYTEETIRIFIDESLEHLSDIENELLEIEQRGADIDENLVNKVYRAAHSIKGGAGFMGLSNIKNLTHEMEDILGKIRAREMIPDAPVIDALLRASDMLRNLLNDIENSDGADITGQMESLKAITEALPDRDRPPGPEPKPITTGAGISFPDESHSFTVPEEQIRNIRKEGKYLYLIRIDGLATETFSGILTEMGECGLVLDSEPRLPLAGDGYPEDTPFLLLFATILKPADVGRLLDPQKSAVYIVTEDHDVKPAPVESGPSETAAPRDSGAGETSGRGIPSGGPVAQKNGGAVPPPPAKPGFVPSAAPRRDAQADAKSEPHVEETKSKTSLRVNIRLLDMLMTLAGELVLSRNQLLQTILRNDRRALEISGQRIDLITSELQEAIMHTRMQPIRTVFDKFPRVVRDLAIKLDKKIDLTVEGKDVELDKSIIENLNDPMTHLIRNAADHGIEAPDERIRQGKDPVGRLRLRAFHEAGQVNIELGDDGRGIDGEEIAKKAIDKGLVSEEVVRGMSAGEKVNLIFLPGFSMSEKITDVSGRGVGMDVVKTNLDSLGGLVNIHSTPGIGTAIHIKLPLTLAIIPSLLVSDGNERYAIPQVNVVELMRVPPARIKERIETVGDARVVRLRDELLPLMRLSGILGVGQDDFSPADKNRGINIVVVFTGVFKYGMIVDKLHDSEEIVVKPLGRHLRDCPGYAGATILGDGRVALILDVADLARIAELATISGAVRKLESAEKSVLPDEDSQLLLLFKNAKKNRFAVPLELVERIEKIRCGDIEIAGGRRVIRYRDLTMPLFDVGDVAQVDKFQEREYALVIVFFVAGMDIGILAIPPIDTVRAAFRMDDTALKQPGISGSAVIDGKTTLIVDVIGIVEAAHPEWFALEGKSGTAGEGKTVVLAEDSKFFRNQMRCAIEDAGYNVLEAEDGRAAWDLLEKNADRVSLVVTDLEMPNLDGFGFTRKIKADERFSHLPVIAVSSLAGKEDIRRAEESGVDKYQIKLDRRKLVECLRHYLGE